MRYRTGLLILTTAILGVLGFRVLQGAGSDLAKFLFVISFILLAVNLAGNLLRNQDRHSGK